MATSLEKFNSVKDKRTELNKALLKPNKENSNVTEEQRKKKGKEGETVYPVRRYSFTSELLTILDIIKCNNKPPSPAPQSRINPREGQKCSIFPSLILGGGGGSCFEFSIYFVQDCHLVHNKVEKLTPIPPISGMRPCEAQKRALFPSSILGAGGGGGSSFSIYFVQDCGILRVR